MNFCHAFQFLTFLDALASLALRVPVRLYVLFFCQPSCRDLVSLKHPVVAGVEQQWPLPRKWRWRLGLASTKHAPKPGLNIKQSDVGAKGTFHTPFSI